MIASGGSSSPIGCMETTLVDFIRKRRERSREEGGSVTLTWRGLSDSPGPSRVYRRGTSGYLEGLGRSWRLFGRLPLRCDVRNLGTSYASALALDEEANARWAHLYGEHRCEVRNHVSFLATPPIHMFHTNGVCVPGSRLTLYSSLVGPQEGCRTADAGWRVSA